MKPVVFLHVPKTAGQTIHSELVRLVGGPAFVSPVRVHTQAAETAQMPTGYRLYSGHIDWIGLDLLPRHSFVFSVLRDPRERIASFYFYLLREARAMDRATLDLPQNLGKRMILDRSADDYFFGGDDDWQRFVRDHYDNFYCSYFATRRMRGHALLDSLSDAEILKRAQGGLDRLTAVYSTDRLSLLEDDLETLFARRPRLTSTYVNAGDHAGGEARWPKLLALLERDASAARLDGFARLDDPLMQAVFTPA